MLHKNVQMVDIDVDHWRNLQELFIESSKEKRRIIVIHENGEIHKFIHSDRIAIEQPIDRVTSPQEDAEKVYQANNEKADFVMILERRAVERYMAEVQNAWLPTQDIDEYVYAMYSKLSDFENGIVTYPGAAKENLGLQWRIGATYEEFHNVVKAIVRPKTTAILGLFEEGKLWASLVLGFDEEMKIELITSVPVKTGADVGSLRDAAGSFVELVQTTHPECSVGLFAQLASFRSWIRSEDKKAELTKLVEQGDFLFNPNLQQLMSS
jgi:hypothetical protein